MFEPILTEDGSAIKMDPETKLPMVKTPEGKEVAWDIDKQLVARKAADEEARERRLALEKLAVALGLETDVRKSQGIDLLVAEAERLAATKPELAELRQKAEAGALDDTAADKIKQKAEELAKERLDAAEAMRKKTERDLAEERSKRTKAEASFADAMRDQGLTDFYNRCRNDKSGKLPPFRDGSLRAFLRAARDGDGNGNRWIPTGQRDENGSPVLVLSDPEAGTVVKGADGIEPLSLADFTRDRLMKSEAVLFEQPGTGPGVKFTKPGSKTFDQMSRSELERAAYEQYSG